MRICAEIATLVVASGIWSFPALGQTAAFPQPAFNRDIRPILSDNCYACHGPDKNMRKANLRLDRAEDAYADRDGKRPIVPGKADESELVRRITSSDPEEVMPPPKSGKKLSAAQVNLLKEWITEGGKYELHWAYQSPRRPSVPAVGNSVWPINPIDNFVLARLEK